ncbi:MAG TPA: MarR family winged helix-turn-helix transcriptional regulator [Reyranella sp.]|nr:MarR family winged helix-turn-helix transcriptional regulator [Reyranella sp.]
MNHSGLDANLKPLEREGLVESAVDPADRLLALTAKGGSRLKAALPIWTRTHAEIDERLAAADAPGLRAGLRALS